MSFEATIGNLVPINAGLEEEYQRGNPLTLDVQGKPQLHVMSLRPLLFEEFGGFKNRAPRISGTFALRGIVARPHRTGAALFYTVVEASPNMYGIHIGHRNFDVLNQVAQELDLSHVAFNRGV